MLPVLPSETMVIAAGVLAAGGDLDLLLSFGIATAAVGLIELVRWLRERRRSAGTVRSGRG